MTPERKSEYEKYGLPYYYSTSEKEIIHDHSCASLNMDEYEFAVKAANSYHELTEQVERLREAAKIGMGTMIVVIDNFPLDEVQKQELKDSLAIVEKALTETEDIHE